MVFAAGSGGCTLSDVSAPLVERPAEEVQDAKYYRRPRYLFVPALEAHNLLGDLDRPVVADKQVLLPFEPSRSCVDTEQKSRMARALARKYDRFAFSDAFNDFMKPLASRFKDKHKRDSEEGKHLRAIEEIRVVAEPGWNAESISLLIYLVLGQPYAGANWATWTTAWSKRLVLTPWITEVNFQVITFKKMTAHDYLASQLLDYENLSVPRD